AISARCAMLSRFISTPVRNWLLTLVDEQSLETRLAAQRIPGRVQPQQRSRQAARDFQRTLESRDRRRMVARERLHLSQSLFRSRPLQLITAVEFHRTPGLFERGFGFARDGTGDAE